MTRPTPSSSFKRCVELEPDSANHHHSLGEVYQVQGELELAAGEFEESLAADPDFPPAITSLALVEALQGDWVQAEDRYRALAEDPAALPRYRLDAAFELASILRSRGRFREAAASPRVGRMLLARPKRYERPWRFRSGGPV